MFPPQTTKQPAANSWGASSNELRSRTSNLSLRVFSMMTPLAKLRPSNKTCGAYVRGLRAVYLLSIKMTYTVQIYANDKSEKGQILRALRNTKMPLVKSCLGQTT